MKEMDQEAMPRLHLLEDATQQSMLILEKTRVASSSGPSSPPSKVSPFVGMITHAHNPNA